MQKLRPLYVLIPGILLTVIVICLFVFVFVPPIKEVRDDYAKKRDDEKTVAETQPQAEDRLARAVENLKVQSAKLAHYINTRGVKISTYQSVPAMVAHWYELQEDLPPAIEEYLESTGCTVVSGFALPAPKIEEPTLGPASFMRLPAQGGFPVTMRGSEEQLRELYTNLKEFRRVATISGLSVNPVGNGDKLEASFSMTIYLLAEGPSDAGGGGAAAGPGGGGMGMPQMPGAPPGGAGGPPGGGSGMGGGGGGPMSPDAGDAELDGDD